MEKFIPVGSILKAHGVKGWLKADFNYPFLFEEDAHPRFLFIGDSAKPLPYFIEGWENKSGIVFLKFDEFYAPEEIEPFRGVALSLPDDVAGEYFDLSEDTELTWAALIGYQLYDEQNVFIGIIEDIIELSHQELIQTTVDEQEVMIPIVKQHVVAVQPERQMLKLHIPEGLLDIYKK